MGYCVEISSTAATSNPDPFLNRCLKAGIITLTLCTQGIDTLKTQAFPVNGKSVVCWNGLILGAAPVFLPVILVLVVAGTFAGFGLTERAAVFLPGTIIVGGFAIFVHSHSSITDQVTCRKSFALGIAFFDGEKSFPIID